MHGEDILRFMYLIFLYPEIYSRIFFSEGDASDEDDAVRLAAHQDEDGNVGGSRWR